VQEGERLREGERRLRALFDSTLDAVLVATDDRVYVDANPAACELFGVSREELLGSSLEDFVPEGQRDAAREAWGAFIERGYMDGEFVLRRPDGALRVADFRARAGFLPGQHLSVLRDVTDRKRAEEELRRARSGTA
jgi:PAS domain S-box-containing protein